MSAAVADANAVGHAFAHVSDLQGYVESVDRTK